jgi:hypothetical protein
MAAAAVCSGWLLSPCSECSRYESGRRHGPTFKVLWVTHFDSFPLYLWLLGHCPDQNRFEKRSRSEATKNSNSKSEASPHSLYYGPSHISMRQTEWAVESCSIGACSRRSRQGPRFITSRPCVSHSSLRTFTTTGRAEVCIAYMRLTANAVRATFQHLAYNHFCNRKYVAYRKRENAAPRMNLPRRRRW